jgi:hypothetical protein
MRLSHRLAAVAFVLGLAGSASAQEPEDADVAKPKATPAGRGVGFGLDNGLFGRAYAQGLRVRFPLGDHFALNLRGISTFGPGGEQDRWEVGGRPELIGHTPVYYNLVRIYGGGGPEVATRIAGQGPPDKTRFGVGGHFGFEFFLKPGMSFFAEIGGHSGDELTVGGTVVAGMMFYPFTAP